MYERTFFLFYFIFDYRLQEIMNGLKNNWIHVEMKTFKNLFCCLQLSILIQLCCQEYAINTKAELSDLTALRAINDVTTTTCYLECTKEKHCHKFSMKIDETVNKFKGYCTLYKKFCDFSNLGGRYNTLVYAYKRVSTSMIMSQDRRSSGTMVCPLFWNHSFANEIFLEMCSCYWLRHPKYCWPVRLYNLVGGSCVL